MAQDDHLGQNYLALGSEGLPAHGDVPVWDQLRRKWLPTAPSGGSITLPEDADTAETDTDLVLKPDGLGGVEWGSAGGDSVLKESDWVQITDAQYKTLSNFTFEVVPGVPGKILAPTQFAVYTETIVSAYTHAIDTDALMLFSATQNNNWSIQQLVASYTLGVSGRIYPSYAMDPAVAGHPEMRSVDAGDGIILAMTGAADFGGGNAGNVIYVKVWYVEVTLP